MKRRTFLGTTLIGLCMPIKALSHNTDSARIAREAFIYLYPMVQNYLSIYQWGLDVGGSQYKGPFNQINNVDRVFTPKDTGVITPNSDTPYSYIFMDLRAEPLVVTLPPVEKDRYYSLQLVDLYTHNVDYLGTREDGNNGGAFLIVGPRWAGRQPPGVKRMVRMPTDIAFAQFRTQLFNPADIEHVKAIQSGYTVVPLSTFLGGPRPPAAPAIDWPKITPETQLPEFWNYANFLLQFADPLPWEGELRARFASIGVAPAPSWPADTLDEATRAAVIAAGKAAFKEIVAGTAQLTTSAGLFGTPAMMKGKYFERALGAFGGIYGNTEVEALYPTYLLDTDGQPFDSANNNYIMRFAPGQLPPVNAFWSVTMYDGRTKFLVENQINRYLINSSMIPSLKQDADGGYTLYLQKSRPATGLVSNWLPAPDGQMAVVSRLYLPKPDALDGRWKPPPIVRGP